MSSSAVPRSHRDMYNNHPLRNFSFLTRFAGIYSYIILLIWNTILIRCNRDYMLHSLSITYRPRSVGTQWIIKAPRAASYGTRVSYVLWVEHINKQSISFIMGCGAFLSTYHHENVLLSFSWAGPLTHHCRPTPAPGGARTNECCDTKHWKRAAIGENNG